MKKKFGLILGLILIIIVSFTSCAQEESYFKFVSKVTDSYGNVISETYYNENSNQIWVYQYEYNNDTNGNLLCSNKTILIYDQNGTLLPPSIECHCNCSSSNDIPTSTLPSKEPQFPLVIINEKGIKVTILDYSEKCSFWNGPEFTVLVENNGDQDIYFRTCNEHVNDFTFDMSLGFGICGVLSPGKKSQTCMALTEAELSEYRINKITDIEFQFEVYFSDSVDGYDWAGTDPIIVKTVNFNFD